MAEEAWLVLSTFPDLETARRLASVMVEEKLAACANIGSPMLSIYRWQEKIEEASEIMVFFKTTAERFPFLQEKLRTLHPYDVPEIIALRVADGLPAYLRWVEESCS